MKKSLEFFSVLSIRPTYTVEFARTPERIPNDEDFYNRPQEKQLQKNLNTPPKNVLNELQGNKKVQTPGRMPQPKTMSTKAQSRLRACVNWMYLFSKKKHVYSIKEKSSFSFYLNWITLTLSAPQQHSDTHIVQHLLQPFLKWLQRQGASMYVLRLEVQPNTGNIHSHIVLSHFIHHQKIREKWNQLQFKHGYLKGKDRWKLIQNTNSTDIKAIKNANGLSREISKYMSKNSGAKQFKTHEEKEVIDKAFNPKHFYFNENTDFSLYRNKLIKKSRFLHCKLWSCSESLSNIKIYFSPFDKGFPELYQALNDVSEVKQLEQCKLYLHPNIKHLQPHGPIREKLTRLYENRINSINQQTRFEVESFYAT